MTVLGFVFFNFKEYTFRNLWKKYKTKIILEIIIQEMIYKKYYWIQSTHLVAMGS
jgi:hypothetical protein